MLCPGGQLVDRAAELRRADLRPEAVHSRAVALGVAVVVLGRGGQQVEAFHGSEYLTWRPADGLLRHHPDLLRQRRAPPRARVHDDRRRHPRPPHAPARRGRLLPHRHRRARRAGRPGGRARGRDAQGARRPQRRPLPGPDAAHQREHRLLHPHLRPAPRQAGPGGHAAHLRQRPRLQGHVRGLVLPPLRGLQDRRRDRAGEHLPDPPHPARPRARGELVLPPLVLPGAARAALRRAVRLRAPARALQRGALVHRRRPAGRLPLPRQARLGRARPVGSRARLLRLVRRAPQLLHGALLRPRRAATRPTSSGPPTSTSSARTSSSSTRSSGRRCCSPPASRCPSTSSSTASC